ncbi:hypothetical protein CDV36_008500 [Fusarium kuroshium]|uniref:Major facilitator superfamily (MFS) profile domain-containing protein n=1 Tax=Fusarium kuroshium TaxID=2010991 RepID=A0A3M2S2V3_9HYPO|nr:hypothetical protein CDV36_008500 [Fusarium kuroshium]
MKVKMFEAWRQTTPYLLFNCAVFLQGAILFGIGTGSFGSLQALPSFLDRFGVENANGKFVLPASRKALMNSLPWLGKILGCLGSEVVIERTGYKKTMYLAGIVQIIAVIIELTSSHWEQFTVGRIIAYAAVGLVENAVPAYNAETSPAAVRGFLSGSIMMFTALGNLWGAGMSRAYSTTLGKEGWIIPTAMQLIPAVGILVLVPFTPESPRWLILKGHKESAKEVLDKIRLKHDISSTLFVLEQTNGNQFVQSYAATFYVDQGLGAMSFTYTMIGQVIGVVGCTFGLVLFDIVGRRPLFIYGSVVCCFLLYLASGIGLDSNPNQAETHTLLACFMILPAFTRISASNNAFLTGAEIGGVKMRKKTMAFGTAIDVAAAFLVTFVTPYLLPSMGVNIGWIFGSVACFSVIWGFLFFPELKVDELFEANMWAWQFSSYETHGAGRLLATLENEGLSAEKATAVKIEHREGADSKLASNV